MMKAMMGVMAAMVVLAMGSTASAVVLTSPYEYVPPDHDLYDLVHQKYYTWGMAKQWQDDEVVISATLYFDDLYNWDNNPNDLWVHLLDNDAGATGIAIGTDNQGGGDNFTGQGVLLVDYHNLTTTPTPQTHAFTTAQVAALNAYADNNGFFALGFDPDCHFYNDGVKLVVETDTKEIIVPEPATMGLLGLGVIAAVIRRKKRRA